VGQFSVLLFHGHLCKRRTGKLVSREAGGRIRTLSATHHLFESFSKPWSALWHVWLYISEKNASAIASYLCWHLYTFFAVCLCLKISILGVLKILPPVQALMEIPEHYGEVCRRGLLGKVPKDRPPEAKVLDLQGISFAPNPSAGYPLDTTV